jgi:glycine hydroxymethyltransferase
MADIAHISGLIAGKAAAIAFVFADVVTTTTHKTLRGPRAGLIFFKKHLEDQMNFAVFPSNQGGPHNNTIAGIAVALKQAATPEFRLYAQQVIANAQSLANTLSKKGYKVVTGGTDNHLILWDLRPLSLTGSKMEKVCDAVGITLNKNAVHGDVSAFTPGGVRIGTPALTSRAFKEQDFVKVAEFLDKACSLALSIQSTSGKMLKDFVVALENNAEVHQLKLEIELFARAFPMPGFDPSTVPESCRF